MGDDTVPIVSRRSLLGLLGGSGAASIAGCSDTSGSDTRANVDVVAGPNGRLVYEPETLSARTGDTVTWFFDSPGHNVCGRPGDSDVVRVPAGADAYASYSPDQSPLRTIETGELFDHQFTVPGTYVYVCVPHERTGMIGWVEVRD